MNQIDKILSFMAHIKKPYTIEEIFDIYESSNYNSELLLQHCLIILMDTLAQNKKQNLMDTLAQNKKQKIGKILDNIDLQTKQLNQILEKIYVSPTIETEKEFVDSCNYLQMLAKQALSETGYYKSLCGVPRAKYAPEELEGDISNFSDYINIEFNRLEKQIEDGNKCKPIQEPDATKEEWLKSVERAKTFYAKIYREAKEFFDNNEDKSFNPEPVETHIILDEEINNMARGYMVGPVGLFRNKLVEAVVQMFDNFSEMQTFLRVKSKARDMVLYMTYEQAGKYFFRGAFVDKM